MSHVVSSVIVCICIHCNSFRGKKVKWMILIKNMHYYRLLSTEQKKRKRYKIRLFIFRVEWQHNFSPSLIVVRFLHFARLLTFTNNNGDKSSRWWKWNKLLWTILTTSDLLMMKTFRSHSFAELRCLANFRYSEFDDLQWNEERE